MMAKSSLMMAKYSLMMAESSLIMVRENPKNYERRFFGTSRFQNRSNSTFDLVFLRGTFFSGCDVRRDVFAILNV